MDVSLQLANNFKTYKRFDYLVKYFGLVINDETLNNLSIFYKITKRAEQIEKSNKLYAGFLQEYMPEFVMEYTSAQGRSYMRTSFLFFSSNIMWLYLQVQTLLKKRNSRMVQRNLLTPQLRDAILRRDNWTCQNCGNSVFNEPNLLLEVDHIIPISKGGKTEPNNLQTLCWRCNRQKSDNI